MGCHRELILFSKQVTFKDWRIPLIDYQYQSFVVNYKQYHIMWFPVHTMTNIIPYSKELRLSFSMVFHNSCHSILNIWNIYIYICIYTCVCLLSLTLTQGCNVRWHGLVILWHSDFIFHALTIDLIILCKLLPKTNFKEFWKYSVAHIWMNIENIGMIWIRGSWYKGCYHSAPNTHSLWHQFFTKPSQYWYIQDNVERSNRHI